MNHLMLKKKPVLITSLLALCLPVSFTGAPISLLKPVGLKCNSLVEPLGIDPTAAQLSWRLQDGRWGAIQTAYQIRVASSAALLTAGKPDIWDSGRIESSQSVNIAYAGPSLRPETRYYWLVTVWDKDGHRYPVSDISWWETGLLNGANWRAKWIGFEEPEHRQIRESGAAWITNPEVPNFRGTGDTHHDFRFRFGIEKPVTRAALYVAGEDSPAAWVNGQQVLEAQPMPRWQHAPWKTYTREDITPALRQGNNLLAIGVTRYQGQHESAAALITRTPMSACLYIEWSDGSAATFVTAAHGWEASLNAVGNWFAPGYDDSSWKEAEAYTSQAVLGESSTGNPWPTGPVMILRRSFDVAKPVRSARLYATALGAYKFHLNGSVVGDQILSPGWMDFRQHVPYQAYDVTSQVKTGKNALAAYLAPGWYTTPLMWLREGYNYGSTPPALKAQLRIEHVDGSVDWIATDESWKADVSPILKAEIYDGETYDARRRAAGLGYRFLSGRELE